MPSGSTINPRIDPIELGKLLDENLNSLRLYASNWCRSPDDCVQEAFVELAAQPSRPVQPRAWLYRVVRNRAMNAARAERRRRNHEISAVRTESGYQNPVFQLEAAEEHQRLLTTLCRLKDPDRELVLLRIWSGLTWQEIGELTQSSSSTAQRRYANIIQELRNQLTDQGKGSHV